MSFWDSIKGKAQQVGNAAGIASQKTKLRTEILLIDRELKARKQNFGIQLYDYVIPLAKTPSFFASDDTLTATLRPPLITAQREIAALEIRVDRQKEQMKQAEEKRKGAFPVPATNWQEKLTNAGKSTAMAGSEAKLSTELSMLEVQLKAFKQQFGLDLYPTLENLEDTQGWLPTDREIRSMYDACRKDCEAINLKKIFKQEELTVLGGGNPDTDKQQQQQQQQQQHNQEQQQPGLRATAVTPPPPTTASMEYADPFADPFDASIPSQPNAPPLASATQPSRFSDVPPSLQQHSQYVAPSSLMGSSTQSTQQGSQPADPFATSSSLMGSSTQQGSQPADPFDLLS
jgi:hypothetical protein